MGGVDIGFYTETFLWAVLKSLCHAFPLFVTEESESRLETLIEDKIGNFSGLTLHFAICPVGLYMCVYIRIYNTHTHTYLRCIQRAPLHVSLILAMWILPPCSVRVSGAAACASSQTRILRMGSFISHGFRFCLRTLRQRLRGELA